MQSILFPIAHCWEERKGRKGTDCRHFIGRTCIPHIKILSKINLDTLQNFMEEIINIKEVDERKDKREIIRQAAVVVGLTVDTSLVGFFSQ